MRKREKLEKELQEKQIELENTQRDIKEHEEAGRAEKPYPLSDGDQHEKQD